MNSDGAVTIRLLDINDLELLINVQSDVFDKPINLKLSTEFLNDKHHHLVVAIVDGIIIGMATALHYIHPDKSAELWINEIGVSKNYQKQGIGKRLLKTLLDHGKILGCKEAWVLTENDNIAAQKLYKSVNAKIEKSPVYFSFDLK